MLMVTPASAAATPKINPKMDIVPSCKPKATVPADLVSQACNRLRVEAVEAKVSAVPFGGSERCTLPPNGAGAAC